MPLADGLHLRSSCHHYSLQCWAASLSSQSFKLQRHLAVPGASTECRGMGGGNLCRAPGSREYTGLPIHLGIFVQSHLFLFLSKQKQNKNPLYKSATGSIAHHFLRFISSCLNSGVSQKWDFHFTDKYGCPVLSYLILRLPDQSPLGFSSLCHGLSIAFFYFR